MHSYNKTPPYKLNIPQDMMAEDPLLARAKTLSMAVNMAFGTDNSPVKTIAMTSNNYNYNYAGGGGDAGGSSSPTKSYSPTRIRGKLKMLQIFLLLLLLIIYADLYKLTRVYIN